jgi:HEAT repeat protein
MTTTAHIDFLIHDLGNHDGFVAQRARKKLAQLGEEAVPALTLALRTGSERTRWEAAMALQEMYAPQAAEDLVSALEDANQCVRWVAGQTLIKLTTHSYAPLLAALVAHPERTRLRHGAHHVLHSIFMMPVVKAELQAVYTALDTHAPPAELRRAASAALEAVTTHLG